MTQFCTSTSNRPFESASWCSASEPGVKHFLVSKDGIEGCDCRGFFYRKSCRHIEALRNRLAREATTAQRRVGRTATVSELYAA